MGSKLPAHLKLQRSRAGVDGAALLAALREAGETLAVVKHTQAATVLAGEVRVGGDALGVVLKVRRGGGLSEALKIAARESQLHRQWRGTELLARAGIPTATGLALWSGREDGQVVVVAAFERLDGEDLIHLYERGVLTGRLAREAGRLAGQVLRAGLFNRDQKPSNIIALADGRLAVVDTVGVRRLRPGERLALRTRSQHSPAVPMLASLVIEPIGVRRPPRRTLCWRGLQGFAAAAGIDERAILKALWGSIAAHITAHEDPTPQDSPL